MRISNLAAAAAALSMIAAPVAASAQNPASKLSVASAQVRAGTATKESSKAFGFIGALALIVLVGGVGFGTGLFNDNDSRPDSN